VQGLGSGFPFPGITEQNPLLGSIFVILTGSCPAVFSEELLFWFLFFLPTCYKFEILSFPSVFLRSPKLEFSVWITKSMRRIFSPHLLACPSIPNDRNSSAGFLSRHHCPLFLHFRNTFTIISGGFSGSSSLDPTSPIAVIRLAPQQVSANVILPIELNRILTQLCDLQTQARPGDKPRQMGAIAPAVRTRLGLCSDLLGLDRILPVPSRGVVSASTFLLL